MKRDSAPERSLPLSLIPMTVVAVGVLILALVLSGSKTGTIVVERIAVSFTTIADGRTRRPRQLVVTTINETSADGIEERALTASSFTRPGFEQVYAGDTIEIYDPSDNTVYETTVQGEQRAMVAQIRSTAPPGSHVSVGVGKVQLASASASSIGYVPGRTSLYQRWLRDGSYKLVGYATVDGRRALELAEASPARSPGGSGAAGFRSSTTVYVTPGSYDPIETVNRAKFQGIQTISVTRWRTYRVLPATAANQRLLSLTARHPHARVVHNAAGLLRAGQLATRTSRVLRG